MPGANYMGGRRNAAKARLKDTTRRTQKGFFGRQRLDILAKGVSAYSTWGKQTPDCSRKPVSLISEIGLAHAFNDAHRTPEVNSFTRYSFIPSPIHVSPCTPHLKKTMPHDEPSSGSRSHSSEVLDALDTYEPTSRRAALDRVLTLPDLAGLSGQKHYKRAGAPSKCPLESKRSQHREQDPFLRRRKRRRTSSESLESYHAANIVSLEECESWKLPSEATSDYNPHKYKHMRAIPSEASLAWPDGDQYSQVGFMRLEDGTLCEDDLDFSEFEAGLEGHRICQSQLSADDLTQLVAYEQDFSHRSSSSSLGLRDTTQSEPPPIFARLRQACMEPNSSHAPHSLRRSHNLRSSLSRPLLPSQAAGRSNVSPGVLRTRQISTHFSPRLKSSSRAVTYSASSRHLLKLQFVAQLPLSSRTSDSVSSQQEHSEPAALLEQFQCSSNSAHRKRHVSGNGSSSPRGLQLRRYPEDWPDNIFEHEDPWSAIGVILGLPPTSPQPKRQNKTDDLNLSLNQMEEMIPNEDPHSLMMLHIGSDSIATWTYDQANQVRGVPHPNSSLARDDCSDALASNVTPSGSQYVSYDTYGDSDMEDRNLVEVIDEVPSYDAEDCARLRERDAYIYKRNCKQQWHHSSGGTENCIGCDTAANAPGQYDDVVPAFQPCSSIAKDCVHCQKPTATLQERIYDPISQNSPALCKRLEDRAKSQEGRTDRRVSFEQSLPVSRAVDNFSEWQEPEANLRGKVDDPVPHAPSHCEEAEGRAELDEGLGASPVRLQASLPSSPLDHDIAGDYMQANLTTRSARCDGEVRASAVHSIPPQGLPAIVALQKLRLHPFSSRNDVHEKTSHAQGVSHDEDAAVQSETIGHSAGVRVDVPDDDLFNEQVLVPLHESVDGSFEPAALELQEVDGVFMGPCLFSSEEESD